MSCPITCRCRNSLLDIRGKTHVVSHILRATRNILKNELIACFGLTAAITNKDEISELKVAQRERKTDLYRTSIQYKVRGSIHGKEVFLVPPQDVALLLKDWISPNLRKHLRQHNVTEGSGQLANHTCCDIHWNANLEVAAHSTPSPTVHPKSYPQKPSTRTWIESIYTSNRQGHDQITKIEQKERGIANISQASTHTYASKTRAQHRLEVNTESGINKQ